jgi:hypothetical protein
MGFLYKATYRVSRKAYIGQTTQPIEKRMLQHQRPSSKCKAFLGAIKKYGWENFDVEWYEISDDELNFYEEMLVALLGTLAPGGYNLREGGGNCGKPSAETRKKMSEAQSGEKNHMYRKNHTPKTKQNISEVLSGRTLAPDTKRKMSEAKTGKKNPMYGKTRTPETKQKISEAQSGDKHPMYGKTLTPETKQKMSEAQSGAKHPSSKKVYQYTTDGTPVDSFGSCREAARSLNKTDGSSISRCARGKREDAHGYKWSYTEL